MTETTQTQLDAPAPPSTPAEAATRLDQLKAIRNGPRDCLAARPDSDANFTTSTIDRER